MMGQNPAGVVCILWERNAMGGQCEKGECPGCGWNLEEHQHRMKQIAGGEGLRKKDGIRYLHIRRKKRGENHV